MSLEDPRPPTNWRRAGLGVSSDGVGGLAWLWEGHERVWGPLDGSRASGQWCRSLPLADMGGTAFGGSPHVGPGGGVMGGRGGITARRSAPAGCSARTGSSSAACSCSSGETPRATGAPPPPACLRGGAGSLVAAPRTPTPLSPTHAWARPCLPTPAHGMTRVTVTLMGPPTPLATPPTLLGGRA